MCKHNCKSQLKYKGELSSFVSSFFKFPSRVPCTFLTGALNFASKLKLVILFVLVRTASLA